MPERKTSRIDAPTFILHWLVAITLTFSLITGLRIAADDPQNALAPLFSALSLQGDVIRWHIWASILLTAGALAYLVLIIKARLGARLAIRSDGSLMRKTHQVLYWLAFALLGFLALSGTMMFLSATPVSYGFVGNLHLIGAWLLVPYLLLHVLFHLADGGLDRILKIFRPVPAYGKAFMTAVPVALLGVAGILGFNHLSGQRLVIAALDEAPKLDGRPDDAIWSKAGHVTIDTHRGVNLPDGEASVSIKALHHGDDLYMLFEWNDQTKSQKHLPLVKTEKGWKVTQTEYGIQDEDSYYEDKFGVMLAKSDELAGAGSTHLGSHPLPGKPGPSGGRGLHYTTDGSIVDVWHWKSVRSGSPMMQQIDDNYFGAPMEPKESGRYTGGYNKDAKTGGGFSMNWESYDNDIVVPKRLPRDPALLEPFQTVDLDPEKGDVLPMALKMEDTLAYSPELDDYPVGTIMPAVLVDGPFEGDRGDVTAVGHWQDGRWCLEVRRKLNTGSEHDIALHKDEPSYLWVAVFDHAQTRHSQHLRPVELVVQ